MADFDMQNPMDPEFLKKLLSQFGPSAEELSQAKKDSIIKGALGLLANSQTPYKTGILGGALSAAGTAGIYGMNDYQQAKHDLMSQKAQAMQLGSSAMGLASQADVFRQKALDRQNQVEWDTIRRGPPQNPTAQQTPQVMDQPPDPNEVGPPSTMAPAVPPALRQSNLPNVPAPQGSAVPFGIPSKKQEAEMLYKQGLFYWNKGSRDLGQSLMDRAEKMMPKFKATETVTKDGKRTLIDRYEDGTKEESQYSPDLEKAHFLDTGGAVGPVDPYNGKPLAPATTKTVTPDATLSSETARRGQDMVNARSRETHADAVANQNKPQIISGPNGEVYAVDARAGTGKEVTAQDGHPLNKGAKPLTEQQANATAFGMRMKAANDIVAELESNPKFDMTSPKNLLANNVVSNYAASPEAQKLYQAKLNFMSASLRKESGAAISQSEYDTENKKYFPQPGDSKEVVAQKREMRNLALKAMDVQAGSKPQNTPQRRTGTIDVRSAADRILAQ